jgi:hypothetical protein
MSFGCRENNTKKDGDNYQNGFHPFCFQALLFLELLYLPLGEMQPLFNLLASAKREFNCIKCVNEKGPGGVERRLMSKTTAYAEVIFSRHETLHQS